MSDVDDPRRPDGAIPSPPGQATSYDEVPYSSYPYPRTHPDHLATLARLFDLDPPPPETCRVLELGAASGGNLIPLAEALPRARFLGLDLSARQVAEGQAAIRALGLTNVELRHADLAQFAAGEGPFDYIICHGVYSWVPRPVQDAILAICRRELSDQGIAYVSYNTYPGWHLRGAVREMMNYHARRFDRAETRIEQSRALLEFLTAATAEQTGAYARLLRDEIEILRRHEDAYLFHEHLEDANEPLYFHEFADRAEAAGLRFLSEAQFSEMVPENFSPEIQETLRRVSTDLLSMEQYLDFVRNRTFRRTLLCRAELEPARHVTAARLRGLYLAAPFAGGEPNTDEPGEMTYRHPHGALLSISAPEQRRVIERVSAAWPGSLALDELSREWPDARPGEALPEGLAHFVLRLYASELVELRPGPDRFTTLVSARPRAGALARLQAPTSPWVTNRRHEQVTLTPADRQLLGLLDGRHDRAALVASLTECVTAGLLRLEFDERALREPGEVAAAWGDALDPLLERLARRALLVE